MVDILYVLVAVTGVEGETAAVAAIENLSNNEQGFEVMETVMDGTEDANPMEPVIHFP